MRKLVILFILVTWTRSVAVADHDKCNADRAWKLFVCDGNQWQAIKTDDILDNRGSPKNPGKSCDDIKDKRPNAENGIYYITLGGKSSFLEFNCNLCVHRLSSFHFISVLAQMSMFFSRGHFTLPFFV